MRQIKLYRIKIVRKRFQSNVGRAFFDRSRFIKIPIIRDLESIYIILHEIGHVACGHISSSKNIFSYIEEMEAEQYALRFLKAWNIHRLFPEDYRQIKARTEHYVRCTILDNIELGLTISGISLKALRFCKIASFVKKDQAVRQLSSKKRKK